MRRLGSSKCVYFALLLVGCQFDGTRASQPACPEAAGFANAGSSGLAVGSRAGNMGTAGLRATDDSSSIAAGRGGSGPATVGRFGNAGASGAAGSRFISAGNGFTPTDFVSAGNGFTPTDGITVGAAGSAHTPSQASDAGGSGSAGQSGSTGQSGSAGQSGSMGQAGSAACIPTVETCDGLDNDCDGLIDYSVVLGRPSSACDCAPVEPALLAGSVAKRTDTTSSVTVSCWQASTSEVEFKYEVGIGAWATCTVSMAADYRSFDGDFGNSGLLEVRFCVETVFDDLGEPMPPGTLNLWYGADPWRKRLQLLDANNPFRGCATKYFSPADAGFPGWTELGSCGGRCGKTDCPNNQLKAGEAPLILAVEGDTTGTRALDVRLVSVRYLPSGCICHADKDCKAASDNHCNAQQAESSQSLATPICPREPVQSGRCVSSSWSNCLDTVGRFADGLSRATDAFQEAFKLHSPRIGCPGTPTPASNPYVHVVSSVQLQDYYQPNKAQSYSTEDGWTALVYNSRLNRASLLSGMVWATYKCINRGGTDFGGPGLLGAPIDEQTWDGVMVRQEFEQGIVTWSPASNTVPSQIDVYLSKDSDTARLAPSCASLDSVVRFHPS